jgi:DNA polymerase-3 subunit alpha
MTTRMTIDVAPSCFEDLIALMALIRPGPMEMAPDYIARKHGRTEIEYMHPQMEAILSETYGVALYQEQVIRIANVLAGFSMAEGDGLRKAMGKKLPEEMAKYRERFVSGCVQNGIKERLGGEIFDMIERFAGYGFNKAHSAAYAVIAAQTAYMKANYPVEFMAAMLTNDIGNTEKLVFNIVECRRSGIPVLPPDVNASETEFSVETTSDGKEAVRFGLSAIRNVGEGASRAIVEARQASSDLRFTDLDMFCREVDWSIVSKRVVDCLAKCGAMDAFGATRSQVIGGLEAAISAGQQHQKASAKGQMGLFEMGGLVSLAPIGRPLIEAPEIDRRQLLTWEKELLGTYLSDHPLSGLAVRAKRAGRMAVLDLANRPAGEQVKLIGMVAGVRRIVTKNNRSMAVIDFEDLSGNIELVAFPDCFETYGDRFEVDVILDVTAKVDRRNEQLQLICEAVADDLSELGEEPAPSRTVHVRVPRSPDVWADIRLMQEIDAILGRFEGDDAVVIHVPVNGSRVALRSRKHRVDWCEHLAVALGDVLGNDEIEVEEPRLAS